MFTSSFDSIVTSNLGKTGQKDFSITLLGHLMFVSSSKYYQSLTIFLNLEPVDYPVPIRINIDFVVSFDTLRVQSIFELHDSPIGSLVYPLSDSVAIGILWKNM